MLSTLRTTEARSFNAPGVFCFPLIGTLTATFVHTYLLLQGIKVVDNNANEQIEHKKWPKDNKRNEIYIRNHIAIHLGLLINLWRSNVNENELYYGSRLPILILFSQLQTMLIFCIPLVSFSLFRTCILLTIIYPNRGK